jgi:hypothetical protein
MDTPIGIRFLLSATLTLLASPARAAPLVDFRADRGVVTDASGRVSLWHDQSANGFDASSAAGPMLVTGGTSPVLRFNGSQRLLAPAQLPPTGTLFIVFGGRAGADATGRPMGWEDGCCGFHGVGILAIPGSGVDAILRHNAIIADILSLPNATTLEVDAISWGAAGVTFERRLNNGSTLSMSNHNLTSVTSGGYPLHIGSSGDNLFFFNGDLAELMVDGTQLSATERRSVIDTLFARWMVGCLPSTCADLGPNACGSPGDGCGGTLSCGSCALGYACGETEPNLCGLVCTTDELSVLVHQFLGAVSSSYDAQIASIVGAGNATSRAGKVGAFINHVQAQTDKDFTPEQASLLIQIADCL